MITGHATDLARKISSLPEDRIYLITVGGDGTLNEVINGITDFSRIVLGILPIGSGNDFARGMGISKDTLSNLEQMLDLIESASEGTAIDLGEVSCEALDTPKYFAISSGAIGTPPPSTRRFIPAEKIIWLTCIVSP